MIALDRKLAERKLKTRMVLQVHDELLFEVPLDETDEVAALVRAEMEGVVKLNVPLVADLGVRAELARSEVRVNAGFLKSASALINIWVRHRRSARDYDKWDLIGAFLSETRHCGIVAKVSAKHLPAYLDEMTFRFNDRAIPYLFRDAFIELIEAPVFEYKKLTAA